MNTLHSSQSNQKSSLLRKSSSTILSLTSNALSLAVATALRLADQSSSDPESKEALAIAVSNALGLSTEKTEMLREISLDQVSWHDHSGDCWIVVYDRVYDITDFLYEHPGGEDVLLEYAGRDATLAFRGVGHSGHAWRALDKYLIGVLPEKERIFKNGGEKAIEATPFAANLAVSAASC